MPITNINRYFVGEPNLVGIVTTDNLSTVTTVGYFTSQASEVELIQHGGFQFTPTDLVLMIYSDGIGFFTYDIDTDTFTVNATPGSVILPVVAGNFANWANTAGGLKDAGYSPTSTSFSKVVILNPNNSGGVPRPAYIPVFFDSTGTICQQEAGSSMFTSGPLQVNGSLQINDQMAVNNSTPGNSRVLLSCNANPGNFDTNIRNDITLGQPTNFFLADPQVSNCSFATFPQFPVTVPAGNLIVAGTAPGTLVDGGSPVTGFVSTSGTTTMNNGSKLIFDHGFPTTIQPGDTVTNNHQAGIIVTNSLTTPGSSFYSFTLNNTLIVSGSNILLTLEYGSNTTKNIECVLLTPAVNGSCIITLINNNSAALNGDMIINFFIPY